MASVSTGRPRSAPGKVVSLVRTVEEITYRIEVGQGERDKLDGHTSTASLSASDQARRKGRIRSPVTSTQALVTI